MTLIDEWYLGVGDDRVLYLSTAGLEGRRGLGLALYLGTTCRAAAIINVIIWFYYGVGLHFILIFGHLFICFFQLFPAYIHAYIYKS